MRVWFGFGSAAVAAGLSSAMLIGTVDIARSINCKPNHFKPPFVAKTMGPCHFDIDTMSYAGTPVEQALCLMRGMDASRNLAPPMPSLPAVLAERVGGTTGLPSKEAVSGYLSRQDLEWDFAARLWQPLSRARGNDPDAPQARYFVIHDTSGPNFGRRSFPDDINAGGHLNNLKNFVCADDWGKAHIVVNRTGDMLVDHDYAVPWRETKFEQAANFAGALKGLFVHNELIQPRRRGARGGDGGSPNPAFTPAQYDRIALLYTIASVRAGDWLIPAFHAAIDAEIYNGHDDPLNFDVPSFADSLDRLLKTLNDPQQTRPIAPNAETLQANAGASDAAIDLAVVIPAAPPQTDAIGRGDTAGAAEQATTSERAQRSASAQSCTHHRRRHCAVASAKRQEGISVQAADGEVIHHGARHHHGESHTRHARDLTRHGRA